VEMAVACTSRLIEECNNAQQESTMACSQMTTRHNMHSDS
jgi:hypothetical protein